MLAIDNVNALGVYVTMGRLGNLKLRLTLLILRPILRPMVTFAALLVVCLGPTYFGNLW